MHDGVVSEVWCKGERVKLLADGRACIIRKQRLPGNHQDHHGLRRVYGTVERCPACKRPYFARHGKGAYCSARCGKLGDRNPARRAAGDRRAIHLQTLDIYFSWIIRAPGRCLKCGTTNNLQCAHIVSRGYKSVRWDEDNAVPLCRADHVLFTHRPIEWEAQVGAWFGPQRLIDLKRRALVLWNKDSRAVYGRLMARLNELGISPKWAKHKKVAGSPEVKA